MSRDIDEIEAVILELQEGRDARDTLIENAAIKLDGSDSKNAARLRSVNHSKEIAGGSTICIHDRIRRDDEGNILIMFHTRYDYDDVTNGDGETDLGLRSRLVDESFNVTGSHTVENL